MNSYFDLRDDQKSIVSELTSGVPLQSTRCIQYNRTIIFYKWSSENRFFFNQSVACVEKTQLWAVLINC